MRRRPKHGSQSEKASEGQARSLTRPDPGNGTNAREECDDAAMAGLAKNRQLKRERNAGRQGIDRFRVCDKVVRAFMVSCESLTFSLEE